MLPRHDILIAAIFIPYMLVMLTLAVFIYRTGHPRDRSIDEDEDRDRDPDLPVAA